MVLGARCIYYQDVLHNLTIRNRRYIFMLPPLPLMTTIVLLILHFL
jgi:hypothetical protein